MNCDIHLTDKLAVYADEVRRGLGIEIVPPCVNRSGARFTVREGRIHYALGALKNVGVEAMRLIEEARGDEPFADLFDFARRVDLKRIGRRPLEMLARAGAFDALDPNRRRVFESLETLIGWSAAVHEARASAQVSLFGSGGDDLPPPRLAEVEDWLAGERLAEEHAAIGFYLTGHPLDDYMGPLRRRGVVTIAELQQRARTAPFLGRIAGTVAGRRERKSARGNRYAFVQLSDPTGSYEATVFSDVLEGARHLLESGSRVVLTVEASMEGEQLRITARGVEPIEAVAAAAAPRGLRIHVTDGAVLATIRRVCEREQGRVDRRQRGPIHLHLAAPDLPGEVVVDIGEDWPVSPEVRAALRHLPGVSAIEEF
ncbi:MAG: DNA polymerase III subunit alpha, partial [Alphaproteobacteria bacterium]